MFKIFQTLEDAQNYCNEKTALLQEGGQTTLWAILQELTDGTFAVYSEDDDAVEINSELFLMLNNQ